MTKKRSLKLRITMWYSLFMFTITFVLAAIVLIVINKNSETVIKENLKSTVEAAAAEITGTKGTDIMRLLDQSVDGHYVAVYGKNGELLAGIEPKYDEKSLYEFKNQLFQTRIFQSEVYYIYDQKLELDNGELWVRGYIHVMSQTEYLKLMERILFIALPIIVVIMIAGGWFLTKRALKPLEQMEQETKNITNGDDLGKRLYVENGYDEIQKLSITVNEMLQRLQNSFETERQFISDASHELRTPISVILMQCESFDKNSDIFEYEQGNKLIARQTNKMKALVDNLLQLSRLNSQNFVRNWEECNISNLVHELIVEQKMIHEETEYKEDIFPNIILKCNFQLLERAVVNLLNNAYKYGGTIIRISVSQSKDNIKICVSDNGIGMKQDDMDKIWNRFYQVDKSRSGDHGFGLGLSLVKSIADIHNGTIQVESILGEGSVFTLLIPK